MAMTNAERQRLWRERRAEREGRAYRPRTGPPATLKTPPAAPPASGRRAGRKRGPARSARARAEMLERIDAAVDAGWELASTLAASALREAVDEGRKIPDALAVRIIEGYARRRGAAKQADAAAAPAAPFPGAPGGGPVVYFDSATGVWSSWRPGGGPPGPAAQAEIVRAERALAAARRRAGGGKVVPIAADAAAR